MKPRNTGILLLMALLLGAFLWFYEIGGEQARLDSEQAAKRLFQGFEAGDVEWIEIVSRDGHDARFERREADWWMVEPLEFPAADAVERMADTLSSLVSEAVFADPQPDAEYGLDEAARVLRFGAGGESHELRLGRDTPVGTHRYARTGEVGRIYTVAGYRTTGFDADLSAWREKKVLDFDAASVREVELGWPGGRVVAQRSAGEEPAESADPGPSEWRLTHPLKSRADDQALDSLLSTLSFLRADGFLDEAGAEALALLDPPDLSVQLVREGQERPLRLELSRPDAERRRYVRVAGRDTLFELPADRIADFPREVAAYRDRRLASFSATEAAHVDFFFRAPGSDPVVIRARKDGSVWSAEPEAFAEGALRRVVGELSRLEAEDILAESMGDDELVALHLAPPNTVVSVFGEAPEAGEGEEPAAAPHLAELHLGRVTPEGIVARIAGRETVYRLPIELGEDLPVSLEAFRNRFRAEEEQEPPEEPPPDPDFDPLAPLSPAAESP